MRIAPKSPLSLAFLSPFALAPALITVLLLLPLLGGLGFTGAAALGWIWPSNGDSLWLIPGLRGGLMVTLISGLGSSLVALLSVAAFLALGWRRLKPLPQPLLAIPHAALAIGLAFLVAPTGLLTRWASPWLTGWEVPPDYIAPGDRWGLWLFAGLWIKESAFLLFMALAALQQFPAQKLYRQAVSLGHSPVAAFWRAVWPQLWPYLRLPSLAVLAYGLSTVDMARVLGPSTPPPLAVLIDQGFTQSGYETQAAQAALLLSLLVLATAVLSEAVLRLWRRWQAGRLRGREAAWPLFSLALGGGALLLWLAGWLSLLALGLWSLATRWRRFDWDFPAALSLRHWQTAWQARDVWLNTVSLGLTSTGIAILLALLALEREARRNRTMGLVASATLYAPLLVPQLSFLLGFAVILARLGMNGSWMAVLWAHFLFVFPYVFLTLATAMRRLDKGLLNQGRALGLSANKLLWRVKLPLLLRPVLAALAIGIAVSLAQYLATRYAGALRIDTLATEAVRRSAGRSPALAASFALAQAAVPLLFFVLSLTLPALISAKRRDW